MKVCTQALSVFSRIHQLLRTGATSQ
uniref:Uncharacterized protein n=1 Tax=Rhizophora mucronata TaxID=61149 RepID=A0A2P2IKL7_RHIMU